MELIKDFSLVTGRIFTIYPLLLFVALFMGRRSIGEIPVFDFLIFLSLGSVVGADIADPKIEHIHTAFAIIVIALLQKLMSYLLVNKRKFGKLITFEPVIVIKDGRFIVDNMKQTKYSVDNILHLLREKEIFDISSVDVAILEANGKLSVHKLPGKTPVTREDLGLPVPGAGLAYPLIMEGKLEMETMAKLGIDTDWVIGELNKQNLTMQDVFFAAVNDKSALAVTAYESDPQLPPIHR